ncbi:hypothetical protein GGD41_006097 [Paraburkholderia bryophila]|uniref:Uncharacterized protein n=1 Tax=Paraburkholderia bryophila TaxID=420952 RepID=A0A7Y9WDI5_9BURK|nr:hypothetical protein [Paraburkholderia bryophila]
MAAKKASRKPAAKRDHGNGGGKPGAKTK